MWRCLVLKVNFHYFNIEESFVLRDHKTIRILQQSSISLTLLALKMAIQEKPLRMILTLILTLIFSISYFIRVAEGPAAQAHSVYWWDQIWYVFVSITTTGYGDFVAKTHMGRIAG